MRERVLKMMTDAGMSPGDALRAFSAIVMVAIGLAFVDLTFQEPDGSSSFSRRFEHARRWSEDAEQAQPTTRKAFAAAQRFDMGETFELSLRKLIAGFELAQVAKSAG